jgi:hypothetical protein
MWKIFDVVPGVVWAVALAVTTAVAGANYVRFTNERAAHAKTREHDAAVALEMEQKARAKEQELRLQVEKVAINAQAKAQELSRRASDALVAVGELRNTIAALNAREPAGDSGAPGAAHGAAEARELLGSCADEYRAVAADADALRNQVTGLQEYAVSVSRNGR